MNKMVLEVVLRNTEVLIVYSRKKLIIKALSRLFTFGDLVEVEVTRHLEKSKVAASQ